MVGGWLWGSSLASWAVGPLPTFQEQSWEKLGDREISDWGKRALAIEAPRWKHGETEHFVIHFFRSGDKISRRSEEFYGEIREFFGNRPDRLGGRKSHIFALHDRRDWEAFLTQVGWPKVGGITRGDEFYYLATGDDGRFDHKGRVQAHEMTHLIINRFFRGRLPLWLNEGIAEYFGHRKTMSTIEFRRLMGQTEPYDLAALFAATDYPRDPKSVQAFYAEAAIVVDFLTKSPDQRSLLTKLMDRLIAGDDLARALSGYGYQDLETFADAYRKYRRRF